MKSGVLYKLNKTNKNKEKIYTFIKLLKNSFIEKHLEQSKNRKININRIISNLTKLYPFFNITLYSSIKAS